MMGIRNYVDSFCSRIGLRFFYGNFIVASSLVITSAMWGGYYAFGVFFNPVLKEFGWTRAVTAGAFSLASIINGILTIIVGWLTDKFGPRIVMTLCGFLFGLGFILMSQIRAPFHLYLFYGILVGAGMSGSFVPLISTVSKWFIRKRSLMTGIVASGTGVGALLGPTLASRLISVYGWRMAYAILGGFLLLIIVSFSQVLKKNPAQIGQSAYGEDQKDLEMANLKSEGLSLREAICDGPFWLFFATGFCYGYCVFSTMVHITPHGIELGISAIRAANLIATVGAMGILGKVWWGMIGDIIGNKQILIIGFVFVLTALAGLVLSETPWILFAFAGIFGFGYGAITVSHSPIIAELFGLKSHGLIFGVFDISVMAGGAIGPLMTGYIFDLTHSYRIAFLVSAIISLFGIVLSIILLKSKRQKSIYYGMKGEVSKI